jgi:hypothetical protein
MAWIPLPKGSYNNKKKQPRHIVPEAVRQAQARKAHLDAPHAPLKDGDAMPHHLAVYGMAYCGKAGVVITSDIDKIHAGCDDCSVLLDQLLEEGELLSVSIGNGPATAWTKEDVAKYYEYRAKIEKEWEKQLGEGYAPASWLKLPTFTVF